MIQWLVRPLVAASARWIDTTVPVEQLQAFLVRRLREFHARCAVVNVERLAPEVAHDAQEAWRLAAAAGLLQDSDEAIATEPPGSLSPDELVRWVEGVPEGKVVTAKRLFAGTGRHLAALEETRLSKYKAFLDRSLESLLRNVEIRRHGSLQPLVPPVTAEDAWVEKHDVAILFAATARRRRDLRFLNAAMKLNDWAFRSHRRLPWGRALSRYLVALAQQELAAKELLL
ncbi:MAG: hypothetical protein NUV77_21395 [Thermoguttaceae bacterium]|jgi:hypothetical protein|nr:hypothetical protein [Thermoguttaceae bacterium]